MPAYDAYVMEATESVTVMDDGETLVIKFKAEIGGSLALALPTRQGLGLLAGLSAALAKAKSRSSGLDAASFLTPSSIGVLTPAAEPGTTFLQFDVQGVEMNMRIDSAAVEDLILRLQASLADPRSAAASTH